MPAPERQGLLHCKTWGDVIEETIDDPESRKNILEALYALQWSWQEYRKEQTEGILSRGALAEKYEHLRGLRPEDRDMVFQ